MKKSVTSTASDGSYPEEHSKTTLQGIAWSHSGGLAKGCAGLIGDAAANKQTVSTSPAVPATCFATFTTASPSTGTRAPARRHLR
jgi:hypothetical protein